MTAWPVRVCRVCGCTETAACDVGGVPCCWIEEDLCSACAPVKQVLESTDAGLPWLLCVLATAYTLLESAGDEPLEEGVQRCLR